MKGRPHWLGADIKCLIDWSLQQFVTERLRACPYLSVRAARKGRSIGIGIVPSVISGQEGVLHFRHTVLNLRLECSIMDLQNLQASLHSST